MNLTCSLGFQARRTTRGASFEPGLQSSEIWLSFYDKGKVSNSLYSPEFVYLSLTFTLNDAIVLLSCLCLTSHACTHFLRLHETAQSFQAFCLLLGQKWLVKTFGARKDRILLPAMHHCPEDPTLTRQKKQANSVCLLHQQRCHTQEKNVTPHLVEPSSKAMSNSSRMFPAVKADGCNAWYVQPPKDVHISNLANM